ncbi:MAG: tRNA lysidine(34) synthetase TilS [Bacillota bacterium]
MDLFAQVKSTIQTYKMISPGDTVLAGVSGGADSVALLHLLNRLKEELGLKLYAGHLNHMFRGEEAEGDARLVESLSREWDIPLVSEKFNVPEYLKNCCLSPQEGAREVRYRFFQKTAARLGANRIALGHHADDQAETILLNLFRGAGLTGLSGIPPVREGVYIRPLIEIRREQIEGYCRACGIPYRVDSSNLKTVYFRNRIRLELIPLLEKKYNPAVVKSLNRLAGIIRDEDACLDEIACKAYEEAASSRDAEKIKISLERMDCYPPAIKRRIIRIAFRELAGRGCVPTFDHIERAMEMAFSPSHQARIDLPGGVLLVKRYRFLEMITARNGFMVPFYQYDLQVPGVTFIPETGRVIAAEVLERSRINDLRRYCGFDAVLDMESLKGNIRVRRRMEGDFFYPLGMSGKTKLKKFFIDQKVPREVRDAIPIVTCGNDIVWVAGHRPDQRFKVSEETVSCLHLRMLES